MEKVSLDERIRYNNEYYHSFYEELKNRTDKRNYDELMHIFYKNLPFKNTYILDIGCGLCQHFKMFSDFGLHPIGVEPSWFLRENCIKEGYDVIDGTFENISQIKLNNKIEGIWCAASFLHVPKYLAVKVLKEIHNILIDKGILFITIRLGNEAYWDNFDSNNNESQKRFIQLYTSEELISFLHDSKFKIIYKRIEDSYWGRSAQWISVIALAD